jgi:hypothetical protein
VFAVNSSLHSLMFHQCHGMAAATLMAIVQIEESA